MSGVSRRIIAHSLDLESHLVRLERLLRRLVAAGLKLKVSKCQLFQRELAFLGHRVNADGLSTDPMKVAAVADWPVPWCLRDVRSFLGLCSYYRKFVEGLSEIAAPLHALTRKNARFC